ncbi:hypothetical protein GOBAR_AA26342 [Gossypium barbadense]|uniref:RRM domain-containing protein n=1 Tax=Gossypium barbadense TaxID=3634 RepID=A0A2P5WTB1_GOSBA|nr:hypothetical protein GOBAR_AA26342 [Gossypium barbadense]
MNDFGYTVELTGLPTKATEKDVYDFFAFSGTIEHVELVRSGEYASTAYVTFKNAYSQETGLAYDDYLVDGATILDQRIYISRWGQYEEEFDFWSPSRSQEDETSSRHDRMDYGGNGFPLELVVYLDYQPPLRSQFVSHAGEAVSFAQDVVKGMLGKGYVLGKDALSKAKTFDASHQVSATAAAKVAKLSERIGLTDKIYVGVDAVRSMDERYHVSENIKSAISVAGRTAAAAANAVVSSSYFSKGALWVSGALDRAAKAAADRGNRGVHQ